MTRVFGSAHHGVRQRILELTETVNNSGETALVDSSRWAIATVQRRLGRGLGSGAPLESHPELDDELLWVVVASALRSGASLLRALDVVANALGAVQGAQLRRFVVRVRWGASWSQATDQAPPRLRPLLATLAPAWEVGASADVALRLLAEQRRRERQSAAQTSAARLAVHLVLPLGLCFLPAFVTLGLVPLVIAFGGGLDL